MSKKSIIIILLVLLSIGIISLYTTFAYDEEVRVLDQSSADYNLIYSLKEDSNRYVSVAANEEKYVDIYLHNTYKSTVRYGMYYYLVNPKKLPDGVAISLASTSSNLLEDTIQADGEKTVSIRIVNSSQDNVDLIVGALVGFENGHIEEILKEGEVLIK